VYKLPITVDEHCREHVSVDGIRIVFNFIAVAFMGKNFYLGTVIIWAIVIDVPACVARL
jgi:hypothetical protein